MKWLKYYSLFESKLSDNFWENVDIAATRIEKEGYGKPVKWLIENVKEFQTVKYGKQICDYDVLFDRWFKLKKENKVLKNVTLGEKIVMLLISWESLGKGLKYKYNPNNLKFSEWYKQPIKLYRGIHSDNEKDPKILDEKNYYSFTLDPDIAEKFTIYNYATGGYVSKKHSKGLIFETEAKPEDFHIFMGGLLDDELEVILKSPIKVEVYKKINL